MAIIIVPLVATFGLHATSVALIAAVVAAVLFARAYSTWIRPEPRIEGAATAMASMRAVAVPLSMLLAVSILRSAVLTAYLTFLPTLVVVRTGSLTLGAAALAEFLFAGRLGAQTRQRAGRSRVARHGPLRASAGSLAAHIAAHTLDVHRGHAHVCVRSSGHGARATAAPGVRRRGLELDDGGGIGSGQHGRASGRRDRGPAGHTGGHHRDDAADGGGDRRRGRVYGCHAQSRQGTLRFG